MPYEVRLPDIGEGIAEGEIVRWLVKPGDAVREDQPLVEVMTDKASVEIPSPRTGVIAALLAEEGQVVPVGSALLAIALPGDPGHAAPSDDRDSGTAGAARAAKAQAAEEETTRWNNEGGAIPEVATRIPSAGPGGAPAAGAWGPGAGPTGPPRRVQATPAVRQLAMQLGVTLETLAGTGPGGSITASDVRQAASAAQTSGSRAAAPRPGPTAAPAARAEVVAAPGGPEERLPLRGLRRKIAEHMRRSIETAAHFTFVAECDMTEVSGRLAALKPRAASDGVRLTYLAFVLKALIDPLRRYPLLNASLDDERQEIVLKRYYYIGVATHTPEGLTVPVIRDADRLSLFGIAREIQRLSEAARTGRLRLEEIQGGTFSVTSTGAKGGVLATPILHHPQVAILGLHEIKKRPAVVEERIVARDLCNLSLSLDHRVVDGAVGADFLYDVVHRLEHPDSWLTGGEIE